MINRTSTPEGAMGWQWGAGPVFRGEGGPALAVQWGQAQETLDLLNEIAQEQDREAWEKQANGQS